MRVTVTPIVIGAHGMVTKGLERRLEELEIRGRIEIIQTAASLWLAWILGRVLETQGDFCHTYSSKKNKATRKKKKNLLSFIFTFFDDPPSKNKRKRKDIQIFGLYQLRKNEDGGDTNYRWRTWNGLQRIEKKDWRNWKTEKESRPSRLQHCWDRLEYWEKSWRP